MPDSARPLLGAYEPFIASLGETDAVCFWFANIHDPEFAGFRKPLYAAARAAGTRVAFGGRMDRSMLEHEMAADYGAVRELTREPRRAARGRDARSASRRPAAPTARSTSAGASGSVDDGVLDQPGAFGNLPAGEIFVAPLATGADGICVIDRSIALAARASSTSRSASRSSAAASSPSRAASAAEAMRRTIAEAGAGADVVAELGIGTNERARVTGSVITDEKVLGTAHVAFGDNASPSYGGDNRAVDPRGRRHGRRDDRGRRHRRLRARRARLGAGWASAALSRATAWQAAPSPRPVKPRPSVPVARTETRPGSHCSAPATLARISSR